MQTMRLFICMDTPAEVKKAVADLQIRLRPLAKGLVSWPRQEGLHLTLKFLGDTDAGRREIAAELVRRAAAEAGPFEMSVGGVGAFPNFKHPRVFWIGIQEPTGKLISMQKRIEKDFSAQGFSAEERPFSPHLTIGRVKDSRGLGDLCCELEKTDLPVMTFIAKEVILMRSELRPDGAVYTPVVKAGLGTRVILS